MTIKRQYRRSIFRAKYARDTGIDVGYIYNKRGGNPEDVISVWIIAVEDVVEFNCRLDEAVCLSAGLTKVATQMLIEQLPHPTVSE